MNLQAFQQAYGIMVPFKVRDARTNNLQGEIGENPSCQNALVNIHSILSKLFGGRDGGQFWCSTKSVVDEEEAFLRVIFSRSRIAFVNPKCMLNTARGFFLH